MSELVKDLEGFDCDVCPNNERLNSRGVKECWEWDGGACVEYAMQWAAARLTDLGYVKVVRCGECRWWKPSEPHELKAEFKACIMRPIYTKPSEFCSEGEAKEVSNA